MWIAEIENHTKARAAVVMTRAATTLPTLSAQPFVYDP
jgi:hypothetical protein